MSEDQKKTHNESERERELEKEILSEKEEIHQIEKVLKKEEGELHSLEEELKDLKRHHEPVTVEVNNQPVKFIKNTVDGSQLKSTAIEQGVLIKQDFTLFEKIGSKLIPIGDSQEVNLHCDQKFRAVAPDDNSML